MDQDAPGRRQPPVNLRVPGAVSTPSAALAFWLNDLREKCGYSYAELARRTSLSGSALHDALTAKTTMTHRTYFAVVTACSEDPQQWRPFWEDVRALVVAGDLPVAAELLTPPFRRPGPPESPGHQPAPSAVEASPERRPEKAERPSTRGLDRSSPPSRSGTALRWMLIALLGVVLTGAGFTAGLVVGRRAQTAHATPVIAGGTMEVEWHRGGAPTYADPSTLAKPGPALPFKRKVRIECRVYDPSVPSVSPDGYWYLIATSPWSGTYYAAANTFLNGDPPNGPYTHNSDTAVKDC